MLTKLINLWDKLRSSYWFIPSLFLIAGVTTVLLLTTDAAHSSERLHYLFQWITLSQSAARLLLATIIGAMTTIVSLVFSLTILTLSIAASQFGPRILRTFITSPSTQFALGSFIALAVYCILLLAFTTDIAPDESFPNIPLGVAVIVAVLNLIYLIPFINGLASIVQAPNVVSRVAADLNDSTERLYPKEFEVDHFNSLQDTVKKLSDDATEHWTITSQSEGYIQGIAQDALVELATQHDAQFVLLRRAGSFIAKGADLVEVYGTQNDELAAQVNRSIVVGTRRTPRDDVECALLELVEVAVRALSPGVNDPFTAMNCIDHMGASLARLASRQLSDSILHDDSGTPRLVLDLPKFGSILDAGFNQIRQHSAASPAILIRMLDTLNEIATNTRCVNDVDSIERHLRMLERDACDVIDETDDLDDIQSRLTTLSQTIADHRESIA